MNIQFSLNNAFLATALAAIVFSAMAYYGQQALYVATIPALSVLGVWYLLRRRFNRSAVVLITTYLGLWALTAIIGTSKLKRHVEKRYEESGIPSVLQIANQDPTYSLVPITIQSRFLLDTPGPWYYFDVFAVPCPLIVIIEEGSVNHINSGSGGRTILLWNGVNWNEVSWHCYWWSE